VIWFLAWIIAAFPALPRFGHGLTSIPRIQLLQPIKAMGLGSRRHRTMCQKQKWSLVGGESGFSGVMFLDCAVEARAQRCGLRTPEARATDVVGFGSRRETTSQRDPRGAQAGRTWTIKEV
jgi:hypothetical protein